MRIVFGGTGEARISGGLIVVMLIAHELRERGHEVEYMNDEPLDGWAEVRVPRRPGTITDPGDLSDVDALITGWNGVGPALEAGVPVVAHLCCGYEPHLWPALREQFETAYRLPTLKLVVAEHLRETLRGELGVEAVVIDNPIDLDAFPMREPRPAGAERPLRVLTVGPEPETPYAPVPFKGIADVIAIVRGLRERGGSLELVRLTPREDPLAAAPEIDELHVGVPPAEVPAIYRSCDVYLGASTPAEGFGMPAIEAACSGLALVLTEIPSLLEVGELDQAAAWYPSGDIDAGIERLEALLADPELAGRRLSPDSRRRLVDRFAPGAVAARVESAIAAARAD